MPTNQRKPAISARLYRVGITSVSRRCDHRTVGMNSDGNKVALRSVNVARGDYFRATNARLDT